MTIDEFQKQIRAKVDEIRTFQKRDLPDIIGKEAVDHFKENFQNEGFTDQQLSCDLLSKIVSLIFCNNHECFHATKIYWKNMNDFIKNGVNFLYNRAVSFFLQKNHPYCRVVRGVD